MMVVVVVVVVMVPSNWWIGEILLASAILAFLWWRNTCLSNTSVSVVHVSFEANDRLSLLIPSHLIHCWVRGVRALGNNDISSITIIILAGNQ